MWTCSSQPPRNLPPPLPLTLSLTGRGGSGRSAPGNPWMAAASPALTPSRTPVGSAAGAGAGAGTGTGAGAGAGVGAGTDAAEDGRAAAPSEPLSEDVQTLLARVPECPPGAGRGAAMEALASWVVDHAPRCGNSRSVTSVSCVWTTVRVRPVLLRCTYIHANPWVHTDVCGCTFVAFKLLGLGPPMLVAAPFSCRCFPAVLCPPALPPPPVLH
jgi:hypothetical protein